MKTFLTPIRTALLWSVMLLLAVVMLYPLLWMIATSLKTNDPALLALEGASASVFPTGGDLISGLFPKIRHWSNFLEVFQRVPFTRYYLNSALIAIAVTAGQLFTSSLAAYAFSRLTFAGRDRLFFLYLGTLIIPTTVTLIPTFVFMSKLGMVDTYFALIIPPMFSAYGTFLLRQFFMGIPVELEEAAYLDGCNAFQTYLNVVIPLSKSALATLGIFTFLGNWQSFLYPLVMTNRDELKTLPLGLLNFVEQNAANWPLLMAASLLALIPVILIFLFGQRYFVSGVRLGGVKG